jgi:3-oxoacyl-[acyl-carrier-protein] synthase-3
MPATSVMLQHRLGISTNAVAFDISYGCSGYIYGLYQAAMLLVAGGCHRVLLCAGDVITPLLHPGDRHVRMVFGDAGSATLIESGNDKIAFSLKTDGSGMNDLHCDKYNIDTNEKQYLFMDGAAIMSFALREVPLIVDDLLKLKQWHANEVGTFALHQANAFMINYLRKKMKITKEAVPITMESTGNTGSASIPLSLTLSHQRLCQENRLDKVVMCGFGVGYSMGAAGVNLSKTIITPPVQYKH